MRRPFSHSARSHPRRFRVYFYASDACPRRPVAGRVGECMGGAAANRWDGRMGVTGKGWSPDWQSPQSAAWWSPGRAQYGLFNEDKALFLMTHLSFQLPSTCVPCGPRRTVLSFQRRGSVPQTQYRRFHTNDVHASRL